MMTINNVDKKGTSLASYHHVVKKELVNTLSCSKEDFEA